MPKKPKIFSDVTTVSLANKAGLKAAGLINDDCTVVSWVRLAPKLRDRKVNQDSVKQLVLLELAQPHPRVDIIRRLVSYLSYSGKEQTMETIKKLLKK